jgi:hypothetical protein
VGLDVFEKRKYFDVTQKDLGVLEKRKYFEVTQSGSGCLGEEEIL